MNTRQVQTALRRLGWDHVAVDGALGPVTARAVRNFQAGYAFHRLAVDGKPGPATHAALQDSLERGGRASAYFRFVEFRCSCGGRQRGCERIRLHAELAYALDRYRELVGGPVEVVSGYRCPGRNRQVGGASSSQHLYGAAADPRAAVSAAAVRRLQLFSGIGRASDGRVRHVDVRHASGHNTTGSTPERPSLWTY